MAYIVTTPGLAQPAVMRSSCPVNRHVVVVARTRGLSASLPHLAHILLALPQDRLEVLVLDDDPAGDPGNGADAVVRELGGQVRVLDRPAAGAAPNNDGLAEALTDDPDIVVQLTADGSHLPAEIEALVTTLVTSGGPVAVGSSLDFRAWDAHALRSMRPELIREVVR